MKNVITVRMKYSAQALAIVLVVLVVAMIIAMAIISKVFNDRVRVADERASVETSEIADNALDSFRSISVANLQSVAQNPNVSLCSFGANYSFIEDGCVLDSYTEYTQFLNLLKTEVPGFNPDPYISSINSSLINQCAGDSTDSELKIIFEKFSEEDSIEIDKDGVFAIVASGPSAPSCTVNLQPAPLGENAGIIVTSIFATYDGDSEVSAFKEYGFSDIQNYCLGSNCATRPGWGNWLTSTGAITGLPAQSGSHSLYEMRIRAIGAPVSLQTSYSPAGCVPTEEIVKISAIVNCGGVSRGKEFVMTGEEWAPGLFDYVLFNGSGPLQMQ